MKQADEELELTRLLEREAGGFEPVLAELRGRVPDATELASLSTRLALQGIDVSPSPSPTMPSPWRKWLVVGGGGGVAAALLFLALRPETSVSPQPRHAPAATLAPSVRAGSTPGLPSSEVSPDVGHSAAHNAPSSAEPSPVAGVVEPGVGSPLQPDQPAASPPSVAVGAAGVGAAAPAANRAASPGTPRGAAPPAAFELNPDSTGAPSEIELLRDARLALKAAPARALELAEQHARVYPSGKLTQERELIAISGLVALGRRTAALSRGARFEQAFPSSPYRKQVGELLR